MTDVCASVRSCYDAGGQGVPSASWRLGVPAVQTPGVSTCTMSYPCKIRNTHRVADAGRVRLGAYAPSLGPPRR